MAERHDRHQGFKLSWGGLPSSVAGSRAGQRAERWRRWSGPHRWSCGL